MNLLLIDSRILDKQYIINGLTSDTKYIIFDYKKDNFDKLYTLINNLSDKTFNRIGLFQENYNKPYYQFFRSCGSYKIKNIKNIDPELDRWIEFSNFLSTLKKNYNMTDFDMMDCNIDNNPDWNYIVSQLESIVEIKINTSNNETGNSAMNGNWILEEGNVNLIGLYFTEDIQKYKYVLNGSSSNNTYLIGDDNKLYSSGYNNVGQLGINDPYIFSKLKQPTGLTIDKITSGENHFMVLYDNGDVYSSGENYNGQLGLGDYDDRMVLTQIINPSGTTIATDIACGQNYTIIVYDDNKVYGCGANGNGQLGLNDTENRNSLSLIPKPGGTTNITHITCGQSHTIIVYDDNKIYSTGYNYYGQLGLDDTTQRETLSLVTNPDPSGNTDVTHIACGSNHTIIVYDNNTVYGTGNNGYGQLCLGNNDQKLTLTQVTNPAGKTTINKVSCGEFNTFIIYDTISVYAAGYNGNGEFGINNYDNTNVLIVIPNPASTINVTNLSAGINFTMILYDNNKLYSTGYNNNGQLGLGNNTQINVLTRINISSNPNINLINCYYNKSYISYGNSLYGCGRGTDGQLSMYDPTFLNEMLIPDNITATPVKIISGYDDWNTGYSHVIVLFDDGEIYGCGDNSNGVLGLGEQDTYYILTHIPNPTEARAIDVYSKSGHTIVLYDNNTIYGCGNNNDGQLSINNEGYDVYTLTQILNPNPDAKIINIESGAAHTLILFDDGKVYGCGYNDDGQLATGNYSNQYELIEIQKPLTNINATKIACCNYSSMILYDNNKVYSCGSNNDEQLGIFNQRIFNQLTQQPDGLVPAKIVSGNTHLIVLYTNGDVYGCGNNSDGQLGLGDNTNRWFLTQISNPSGTTIATDIACGRYYTIIIYDNDTVYATGNNSNGQLGLNSNDSVNVLTQVVNSDNITNIKKIECGYDFTIIAYNDNKVYSCGRNNNGQLGLDDNDDRNELTLITNPSGTTVINNIACGRYHTIISYDNNKVYSCGYNDNGQLGLENYDDINVLTEITNPIGTTNITNFACGQYYTIIIYDNDKAYSCGRNSNGQLGLGDTQERNVLTQISDPSGTSIINNVKCSRDTSYLLYDNNKFYSCGSSSSGKLGLNTYNDINVFTQVNISGDPTINLIGCGVNQSYISFNDLVYGCGSYGSGQLSMYDPRILNEMQLPDISDNIINIKCGLSHVLILYDNYNLYGHGNNNDGQLGLGEPDDITIFYNYYIPTLLTYPSLEANLIDIDCGSYHTVISFSNSDVYTCGNNPDGQLCVGDYIDKYVFTQTQYINDILQVNNFSSISSLFAIILFNKITKPFNGTTTFNTLSTSDYNIYTNNNKTISVNNYDCIFDSSSSGTDIPFDMTINSLIDSTENTNYLFVKYYSSLGDITGANINILTPYLTSSNLNNFRIIKVYNVGDSSYALLGIQNKYFVVQIR